MESNLLIWWSHSEHLPKTPDTTSTYWTPKTVPYSLRTNIFWLCQSQSKLLSGNFLTTSWLCLYKPLTSLSLQHSWLYWSLCLWTCNAYGPNWILFMFANYFWLTICLCKIQFQWFENNYDIKFKILVRHKFVERRLIFRSEILRYQVTCTWKCGITDLTLPLLIL